MTPCLVVATYEFTSTNREIDIVIGKRVEFGDFDITMKRDGEIVANKHVYVECEFVNEGCLSLWARDMPSGIDIVELMTNEDGKVFTDNRNYVPILSGRIVPCNITGNTTHWERRGIRFTSVSTSSTSGTEDASSDTLWITGRVGNGVMVLLEEEEYAKTNWYWTLVSGQYVPPVHLVVTDQFHNPVQHESFERKITVTVTKNDIVKPIIYGTTTKTVDQETGTVQFDDVFLGAYSNPHSHFNTPKVVF
jgi:hypothetical protein